MKIIFMFEKIIYKAKAMRVNFISDEKYLTKRFIKKLGYVPNLVKPESFNEKVTARMIFERDTLHTLLADKVAVRELIEEKIGKKFLVPLIGIYESFSDIKQTELPAQFVLKCSHDSGSAMICCNKEKFDFQAAECKLQKHLQMNMYVMKREWHYKNITARILAEEFIHLYKDEMNKLMITTCRVHCFEGQPKFIEVDVRDNECVEYSNIYDSEWRIQPFTVDMKKNSPVDLVQPPQLSKMLELSQQLNMVKGYSRVDFLLSQEDIYFSEITLTPNAGRMVIEPKEWDLKLGGFWK